jgi:hypothetical protein
LTASSGYITTADESTRLEIAEASDWMVLGPQSSTAVVDARAAAIDKNGVNLDLQYLGKLVVTPSVAKVFTAAPGSGFDFTEEYFYTTPRISSRAKEFAWVNDAVFIATGRAGVLPDGDMEVAYRIFKVG